MTSSGFDPVAALVAAHPGLSPEEAVDLRVDGLREELGALGVDLTPPVDLAACAAALGVDVVEVDDVGLECDGALLESWDGSFRVLLNRANSGWARRRFTLAHELVHTLVPDDPRRARLRTSQVRRRADAAVEKLVDRGAARLLMEPRRFGADLRAAGMTPTGLMGLAERYGVSREAVAVNAVKACEGAAAVAFLRFSLRPTSDWTSLRQEMPRWRVTRAFHGTAFPAYLHPGLAFDDDGIVARAARAECEIVGLETIGKDRAAAYRVAARPLGRAGVEPPGIMVTVAVEGEFRSLCVFRRKRPPNPLDAGHLIRRKPATQSRANRPPVPTHSDHLPERSDAGVHS